MLVRVTGDAVACPRVADRAWEMLVEGVGFRRDFFFDKFKAKATVSQPSESWSSW